MLLSSLCLVGENVILILLQDFYSNIWVDQKQKTTTTKNTRILSWWEGRAKSLFNFISPNNLLNSITSDLPGLFSAGTLTGNTVLLTFLKHVKIWKYIANK